MCRIIYGEFPKGDIPQEFINAMLRVNPKYIIGSSATIKQIHY